MSTPEPSTAGLSTVDIRIFSPLGPDGIGLRPAVPGGKWAARVAGTSGADWVTTRALGRAVLLTGLLLLAAVLRHRADLVVLAAPFALGTGYALSRWPRDLPNARLSAPSDLVGEGTPVRVALRLGNPGPVPYSLVLVRVGASHSLSLKHLDRPLVVPLAGGTSSEVDWRGESLRWGRVPVGPALVYAVAADGLLRAREVRSPPWWLRVAPTTSGFDADDAMPRAAGPVGAHHSRRPGEGGELAGVRRFGPGDRLRRIDWRVSLRTRELHVAATLSDRDAEVVLLLDVLLEAGTSGGVHGAASVLDTTVRAAAGIAEHYLRRGDRVALAEYGFRVRRLRAAGGRRHHMAVLDWLLDVQAYEVPVEPSPYLFGAHLFPPAALVVVLSPLIDPRSARMLAGLARAGRYVVAVDTYPTGPQPDPGGPWSAAAARIWRLDRENTVDLLREHGVPVVPWAGPGSLDQVLRQVARLALAPRIVAR